MALAQINMSTQKPYIKVDCDLFEILSKNGVPDDLAFKYIKLASKIKYIEGKASSDVEISIPKLQIIFGVGSRKIRSMLEELSEHNLIEIKHKEGQSSTFTLLLGVIRGYREDLLQNMNETQGVTTDKSTEKCNGSHAHTLDKSKKDKETLLPTPVKSSRGSFSKISMKKISMAKKYVALLQKNGIKVRAFTLYVNKVCQTNEELDTWDKLEQEVKKLSDHIDEKGIERKQKEREKKEIEQKSTELDRKTDETWKEIAGLSDEKYQEMRKKVVEGLCERQRGQSLWIREKSLVPGSIANKMVRTEMVNIYEEISHN